MALIRGILIGAKFFVFIAVVKKKVFSIKIIN